MTETSEAPPALVMRFAAPDDLPRLKALADPERKSLGFVYRGALARAIAREEVLVAESEGAMTGFCHFYRRRDGVATIYHLVVEPAARRIGIGRQLVEGVASDCGVRGLVGLRLKCPHDLPANSFYARIGFCRIDEEIGRSRNLFLWERSIDTVTELLTVPP
ncbi:MAG: GNAT family N-acetyltransferase [Thermomicrobiales bacterium]